MPKEIENTALLLKALNGVLSQIAEPIDVLKTILAQAVEQTGADRGVFVEIDRGGELDFVVLHHIKRQDLSGDAGRFSRGIFSRVLETGQGVLIEDSRNDPGYMSFESVAFHRLVSVLCMPITIGDRIAALIHLENKVPGHFQNKHVEWLGSLLEIAGPMLEALQSGRDVLDERDQLKLSEIRFKEEARESRELLSRDWSFARFIGRSRVLHELEETLRKVAGSDYPVLLLGETGTGKSILARALHHSSPRASEPLITVFCPSLEREWSRPSSSGTGKAPLPEP